MAVTTAPISELAPAEAWRRRLSYLQDALLIGVSALFFYSHGKYAFETHNPANVFFAAEQAMLIGIFLTRRRTESTSQRPWDWFIAAVGGWAVLAMRPHSGDEMLSLLGSAVQLAGLCLLIVSMMAIGRSFGVVAANRGLKVHGPYRLVRHPVYLAHGVTQVGFVLANLWWPNVVIFAVVTCFQVLRIASEERVLSATSDYAGYRAEVRWRLVPRVF